LLAFVIFFLKLALFFAYTVKIKIGGQGGGLGQLWWWGAQVTPLK